MVLAAGAVNAFDLEDHGVDTVGVIPQGFPPFTIPSISWSDVPPLLLGAIAIAIVALADTMATASAFAARRGEQVRGNQEMIGIVLCAVPPGRLTLRIAPLSLPIAGSSRLPYLQRPFSTPALRRVLSSSDHSSGHHRRSRAVFAYPRPISRSDV